MSNVKAALDVIAAKAPGFKAEVALVLGSGLGGVVDAVSESLDTTRCGNKGDCQNGEKCLTHHLWSDLSDQIHQFLSEISLGDLMRKHEIRQVADRQNRRQSDSGSETINTERLSDQAPA